jgi:predicted metal-binding membrane protein
MRSRAASASNAEPGGNAASHSPTVSVQRPHAVPRSRHRNWFLPVFVALIVVAWMALWMWSQSPYGRYLDHGDWTQVGIAASVCTALPAGDALLPAALYIGGWVLMVTAMMLPTTLPLLETYRRLTQRRHDRWLLVLLVVAGYLSAWSGFGLAAHAADLTLHAAVAGSPWLTFNGWAIGAAVLALAAAFQFSPLKYRCLERCRTTLSFVIEHWRGRHERLQAFRLGLRHGIFCVGCCWALMLLMFVVGTGNVGWMMLLGAVMAAEKNVRWGPRLRVPVGLVLLTAAAGISIDGAFK